MTDPGGPGWVGGMGGGGAPVLGQLPHENMQVVLGLEGWGIWDNVANLTRCSYISEATPPPITTFRSAHAFVQSISELSV